MLQLKSAMGDRTQHYANLNHYATNGLPAAQMVGKFWQIDEPIYMEFLEMLPPIYCEGGFRMCERLTNDIAATYYETPTGYWCAMTDLGVTSPARMFKHIRRIETHNHA